MVLLLQLCQSVPDFLEGMFQPRERRPINFPNMVATLLTSMQILAPRDTSRHRKHPRGLRQSGWADKKNEVCILCQNMHILGYLKGFTNQYQAIMAR